MAVFIFDFTIAVPVSCGADMACIGKKIPKTNMVTARIIFEKSFMSFPPDSRAS